MGIKQSNMGITLSSETVQQMRRDKYLSVFSPNAGKCRKNADQNNSEYGHFLRNVLYKERNDLRVFHNIFGLPMLVYTFACLQ